MTLPLSTRIENARMLWLSQQRRLSWSFAAVATKHALWRFATMNDKPTLPHEESRQSTLNYHCAPADMELIFKIADRGVALGAEYGVEVNRMIAAQDIATLHCNGCPLKLWQFLASDTADFAHDFTAIGRWIDRKAGVLTGGIKLRFAGDKQ